MKKIFNILIVFCALIFLANSTSAQKLSSSNHPFRTDTATGLLKRAEILNPGPFNNPFKKYNYYNCLGVMCQLEFKMQKAIKIPLCFRLGSVEYTNKVDAEPINPNL